MKWEGIKFLSNDTLKEEFCQNHFQSGEGSIGKLSERKGRKYSSNEVSYIWKARKSPLPVRRDSFQIRKESLLNNFRNEKRNIIAQKGK